MADEDYTLGFDTEGTEGAVRDLDRVADAQERVAQGNREMGSTTSSAGSVIQGSLAVTSEAVEQGGRKWGELAGAVGNVGAVFGQANPVIGQAGSLVGAVGAASSALTGALGPLGVALAALTTAGALLVPVLQDTEEELEDVAGEAETAADRVRELAEAFSEANREQRLFSGMGATVAELEEEIQRNNRALEQLGNTADGALARIEALGGSAEDALRFEAAGQGGLLSGEIGDLAREAREAREEVAELEERGRMLREGLQAARVNEGAGSGRTTPDVEGFDSERATEQAEERRRRRASGANDLADRLIEAEERYWDAVNRGLERQRQREQEAATDIARVRGDLYRFFGQLDDEQKQRQEENHQRYLQRLEEQADALKAQQEAEAEARRTKADEAKLQEQQQAQFIEGQWQQISGTVNNAIGGLVKQVINMEESSGEAFLAMLDSFLEATAVEYTIKALAELANAAAAFARQDYVAGPQHLAAAGLAAAVAAATGAASAAIPNASAPPQQAQQAQPQAAAGGEQTGNVTVNLYAPNTVMTEGERGQILVGGIREAKRQFGADAVRI